MAYVRPFRDFGEILYKYEYLKVRDPVPLGESAISLPSVDSSRGLWRRSAWRWHSIPNRPTKPIDDVALSKTRRLADDLVARLDPAIELANVLLARTKPIMERIYFAPIKEHPEHGESMLSRTWKADENTPDIFREVLPELCDIYRIAVQPTYIPALDMEFGVTTTVYDKLQQPDNLLIFTCVAKELLSVIVGPAWTGFPERQRKSVLLVLAVTLVQNVACALWIKRVTKELSMLTPGRRVTHETAEPWIHPGRFNDLKLSVSNYLFGLELTFPLGRINLMYDDKFPETDMTKLKRPLIDGSSGVQAIVRDVNGREHAGFKLAPETVLSFFNWKTWSPIEILGIRLRIIKLYLLPDHVVHGNRDAADGTTFASFSEPRANMER